MSRLSIAPFARVLPFLLLFSIAAAPVWAALEESPVEALPEPEPFPDPRPTFCRVDPERELVIRDLSVVEDCFRTTWDQPCLDRPALPATRGAWTFGKLVEGLAGSADPRVLHEFVMDWLAHWQDPQTINEDDVPERDNIESLVIQPWLDASGGEILDMKQAPFRLLAIVSRLDLRVQPAYGSGNAGEARFVFGVLNLDAPQQVPQFTVIVEYGLNAAQCEQIKTWAERFHDLGSIPFGAQYNAALQEITDDFTTINAAPAKPNGSALNQLRTNEIALAGPWELREFRLQGNGSGVPLTQSTVAQTADRDQNFSDRISDYVNEFEAEIVNGTFVLPLSYQGKAFRGGAAPNNLLRWDGAGAPCSSINNPEARFQFSLNSCQGCHGAETASGFLQISPRAAGFPASLSPFLTGGPSGQGHTVVDDCGLSHTFNELDRRVDDLCKLLEETCEVLAEEKATNRVH